MRADGSLAATQAALVDALTGGREPIAGFDAARLRAVAQVLLRKRIHAVVRACPPLEAEFGTRFGPLFAEYALARPTAGDEDGVTQAWRFMQWIRDREPLPDALRIGGVHLSLQRGALVAFTWLPTARRVVVGVHLPAMPPRLLSVRM